MSYRKRSVVHLLINIHVGPANILQVMFVGLELKKRGNDLHYL